MKKIVIQSIVFLLFLLIMFFISSYYAEDIVDSAPDFFKNPYTGILVFIFLLAFAEIVAPLSFFPLIPIATGLWGALLTSLASLMGWTFGAIIVFLISKKYGLPLVKRFVPIKNIQKIESLIPEDNFIFTIIIMRIFIPVDLLSYGLSLFSRINFRWYLITTIIGLAPFAFIFAYLGKLPLYLQMAGFGIMFLFIFSGWALIYIYNKKELKNQIKNIIEFYS